MIYLAAWYALSGIVFILLGFETRGRSLEELVSALDKPRGATVQPVAQLEAALCPVRCPCARGILQAQRWLSFRCPMALLSRLDHTLPASTGRVSARLVRRFFDMIGVGFLAAAGDDAATQVATWMTSRARVVIRPGPRCRWCRAPSPRSNGEISPPRAMRLNRLPVVGHRAIAGVLVVCVNEGPFETKWLCQPENLGAPADLAARDRRQGFHAYSW